MNTKTDSREKMLAAASRLFQLKGYNATGLNEILQESDSPKGSLYYYFPHGKEELALEAIKLASQSVQQKVKSGLAKHSNPILAIEHIIKDMVQDSGKEATVQKFSISLLALETHLSSEPLRKACEQAYMDLAVIYAEKLIQSGFPQEIAQELGIVIQAMIEGAITISLTQKAPAPLIAVGNQISVLLHHYI
ncbi:MAG: transcriptional regulator, TetR family [Firmicutes bacterium]|nr:transcriptional regulator, TetR family [Bacillota bacterium]